MEDFAHCAAAEDGFRSSSPLFKSDDREHHPMINGKVVRNQLYIIDIIDHDSSAGKPCNKGGNPLSELEMMQPPERLSSLCDPNDWMPFANCAAFKLAEFLFKDNQASAANIDQYLGIMADLLEVHNDRPPFLNHNDVCDKINSIPIGGVPWQSFTFTYEGPKPTLDGPKWMDAEYTIWFRDPHLLFLEMLKNLEFIHSFDYAPYQQYDETGSRQYENFMSGDWAWKHTVRLFLMVYSDDSDTSQLFQDIIAESPANEGAMFVPVMLGSDKTTVSVGTGDNEFWPLYGSVGNIHNNVRRAHGAGFVLIGFLVIPKGNCLSWVFVLSNFWLHSGQGPFFQSNISAILSTTISFISVQDSLVALSCHGETRIDMCCPGLVTTVCILPLSMFY